ncbi:DUF1919 domain-containing protein [Limosilactobacillus ingluviei]
MKQRYSIQRKRLNNNNFSIISANCIGGVIYHNLGLKFLSPTINLWFKPDDFITFLSDIKFYLTEAELVKDERSSAKYGYPVGLLNGEIRLYFQHYDTFTDAKKKWDQRKTRVNFDNLYVIMTDRDGITEDNIREFSELPFKHKVMLTGKEYSNFPVTVYIKNCHENGHLGNVFKRSKITGKSKLDNFDFVSFLNS